MSSSLPILIGQYDSPFVRRVAIAMRHYELPFEHRAWSVFRDAEKIAQYNPLRRVPTLILPFGEVLTESFAILEYLDEQVPAKKLLLPRSGPQRRTGLRVAAFACSMADKGVALVYENVAREAGSQSERWRERCARQLGDTLTLLEREREAIESSWWLGEEMSHADIALGVVTHFLLQAAPEVLQALVIPALLSHEQRCHQRELFQEIDLPLTFPT